MAIATEHQVLTSAELVRAYQAGVWRYLRYLGASDAEADDLTQETFLAVIKRPMQQRSQRETAVYLRTVARRKFLVLRRRGGATVSLDEIEVADDVFDQLAGDGGGELLEALDGCMEQLNGRGGTVIDLHYRQELSREEIAEKMELKPDGVKTLLRRTRAALRECIERKMKQ